MKKPAQHGHTAKHGGSTKHAGAGSKHHPKHPAKKPTRTAAQHPHTVAKAATHPKPRQLTPDGIAACPAEAVAASLRLAGRAIAPEDVLALYWHTTACPDTGASILATLRAAREYGLAGVRPVWFGPVPLDTPGPVILGAEMPGSHALLAEARGWWSWGDLHDPAGWPDAVIEEAWIVRWPAWL